MRVARPTGGGLKPASAHRRGAYPTGWTQLGEQDVFVNVWAAFKLTSLPADLAVAAAIHPQWKDVPSVPDVAVLFGEIGFGCELRMRVNCRRVLP